MSDLSVRGLVAGYGRVTALHAVDLDVAAGRIVALIGANGAGKTTLLRAVSGLLRPRAGTVTLGGADVAGWPAHRIAAAGLSHVPEGRHVFPDLTVAENLTVGGWLCPTAHEATRRREAALTRLPRLRERLRQKAGSLSGGEQQMLAIGRALMAAPRMLLLDEPSMGLAPLIVDEIFRLLAALRADGATILLVEQNAAAALEVSDDAYVLERGRIVLHGPAAQVAAAPEVAAAYLGG
jgi:branched-chain amino acid transport system ATP-binding protein